MPDTPDTPLRTAIVGTGLIARVGHLLAIQASTSDVELVAARYSDLEAMLDAESPDLVIVATPPVLHREQVAAALESGA